MNGKVRNSMGFEVGGVVRVKSVQKRTDGLVDTQEFHARITAVTEFTCDWERIDTIAEDNVFVRTESGGFSTRFGWETLNQIGIFSAPGLNQV
jgi:hypothetical protein